MRLLERLTAEVASRQAALAERGYSSLAEQRDDADRAGQTPLPYLVLMVDDWDSFSETYDEVDHGRPTEMMLQLLREGPAVGLRVVLTGGRSVLLSRVAGLVPGRFCLRMADDSDLMLAGLPSSSLPVRMPPGRAVRVADGVELQVGVLRDDRADPEQPPDASGRAQVTLLRRLGEAATAGGLRPVPTPLRPIRVEPLPTSIALSTVRHEARERAGHTDLVVGVGGDDLSPVAHDPGAGLSFLVAGPAGSGRTTTLRLITHQLLELGREVLIVAEPGSDDVDGGVSRPTPARNATAEVVGRVVTVAPSDATRIRSVIEASPGLVAVVDDVERLVDPGATDALSELARGAHRTGGGVVCAGLTHELLSQFRGLAQEVRRAQTGILLQPSAPADGELFAVRATALGGRVAGRGLHVERGRLTPIQVALPDVLTPDCFTHSRPLLATAEPARGEQSGGE